MQQAIENGFRGTGTETSSSSIAGNALTKISATLNKRSGVLVCNQSATLELLVRMVARNATAPTYANDVAIVRIPAKGTANVSASESVDIYICNSANAATTSAATWQDYSY